MVNDQTSPGSEAPPWPPTLGWTEAPRARWVAGGIGATAAAHGLVGLVSGTGWCTKGVSPGTKMYQGYQDVPGTKGVITPRMWSFSLSGNGDPELQSGVSSCRFRFQGVPALRVMGVARDWIVTAVREDFPSMRIHNLQQLALGLVRTTRELCLGSSGPFRSLALLTLHVLTFGVTMVFPAGKSANELVLDTVAIFCL